MPYDYAREIADIRRHPDREESDYEFNRPQFNKRKINHSCSDGYCGADDCSHCHPERIHEEQD